MNDRILLWGTGRGAEDIYLQAVLLHGIRIIGCIDNNPDKWGTKFHDIPIISPDELQSLDYEAIVITMTQKSAEDSVCHQLLTQYCVPKAKVHKRRDFMKRVEARLTTRIEEKYKNTSNEEICRILEYYHTNGFNIYGDCPADDGRTYWVQRDEDGDPYVELDGKKMFYPRWWKFDQQAGNEYIKNLLGEQTEGSPHLYLRSPEDIPEQGVIVDAGVCEGNFSLRYIDRVKKCYLIEPDPEWEAPLRKTFAPYQDLVVFCNKMLGRYDSDTTVTLDTLVQEPIDFLKMDIEGGEIDGLLGAKKMLQASHAKCAICSYHRQNDEENIRFILDHLGYQTFSSKGYMFFTYDKGIETELDFRRGIVYGER